MFNWFRKKKGKTNGKQLNKDTSDSGAFMPIILTSDEDKNHSSKSEAAGNDYSYSASFDSSDSGGGGGD